MNPAVGQVNRIRAHEEDLAEKVLEKLDYIEGLRVTVQIVTVPAPIPQPAPSPPPVVHSEAESGTAVVANQPIKLEPEPRPAPPPTVKPVGESELTRILVNVPSSFYRKYLNPGESRSQGIARGTAAARGADGEAHQNSRSARHRHSTWPGARHGGDRNVPRRPSG